MRTDSICAGDNYPFGPKVTLATLLPLLIDYASRPLRGTSNVFLWGDPGVGKTSVTRQLAEALGLSYVAYDLPQMDYTQITGVPRWNEELGRMERQPLLWIPSEGDGIYVVDNVPHAPLPVQNVLLALAGRERRLQDSVLGPGWMLVLCGNRPDTGVFPLQPPVANRFAHFDIQVDYSAWKSWASASGIRSEIIEFLGAFPELLFVPPSPGAAVFPSPRAWASLSAELDSIGGAGSGALDPKSEKVFLLACSRVGTAAAAQLLTYLDLSRKVNVSDVISGKSDPWSGVSDADRRVLEYALVGAARKWWLARAKDTSVENLGRILSHLSPSMGAKLLADLAVLDRKGISRFYSIVTTNPRFGWIHSILKEIGTLEIEGAR